MQEIRIKRNCYRYSLWRKRHRRETLQRKKKMREDEEKERSDTREEQKRRMVEVEEEVEMQSAWKMYGKRENRKKVFENVE